MRHKTSWIKALAAGAAVGAVSALMFAPYSGRRMRQMVRRSAEDSLDCLSDKGRKIVDSCENLADNAAHFLKRKAS